MMRRISVDDVNISWVSFCAFLEMMDERDHDDFSEWVEQVEVGIIVVIVIQSCIALKDSYTPHCVFYALSQYFLQQQRQVHANIQGHQRT